LITLRSSPNSVFNAQQSEKSPLTAHLSHVSLVSSTYGDSQLTGGREWSESHVLSITLASEHTHTRLTTSSLPHSSLTTSVKQFSRKLLKNRKIGMTNIFPSKSEYNHIILQVYLHTFHVYFPYRPMRSTKNRPAIDRSIPIDALDMPGLGNVNEWD
jgi:hypothetical protein